jgi:Meiotically up-regulated gene 113
MATLAGQRAQFTWALRQYNLAEDAERKAFYARRMAKYIAAAPVNGFTEGQVTQGQLYPKAEVAQYLGEASIDFDPDISEGQALREVEEAVDVSGLLRLGEGPNVVYAYGYRCAPDRLKRGLTNGDTVQRIAAQISTGTPDKPVLLLEIRTHDCNSLERAIHAILEFRGARIVGAGREWFKASREDVVDIYRSIIGGAQETKDSY